MTLATETRSVTHTGNGVTTVWPYAFKIPDAESLIVELTSLVGGAEVVTVLSSSAFTVLGLGNPAGGTVTYPLSGAPIAAPTRITIKREVDYLQQTDIVNQAGFFPEVIEQALDKAAMALGQLAEEIGRAIRFTSADGPQATLLPAGQRASKFLGFNAAGQLALLTGPVPSTVDIAPLGFHIGQPGVTNNDKLASAFASGKKFAVLTESFALDRNFTIPANFTLDGNGNELTLGANVDAFYLGDRAKVRDLRLDGQARAFRGFTCFTGTKYQQMVNVDVTNFAGYCIEFVNADAGYEFELVNSYMWRTISDPASPCIKLPSSFDTIGMRKFVNIDCGGTYLIDLDASLITFLTNIVTTGIVFKDNSRYAKVSGARLGSDLVLKGLGHTLTNTTPGGALSITLALNAQDCHIEIPTNFTWVDSSGRGDNYLTDFYGQTITPIWNGSGSNPVLGNGTWRAKLKRLGNILRLEIELIMGTTTTFGTGNWTFAIPAPFQSMTFPARKISGTAHYFDSSTGNSYLGSVFMNQNVNAIFLYTNAGPAATVTPTSPFTWASGDTIAFNLEIPLT